MTNQQTIEQVAGKITEYAIAGLASGEPLPTLLSNIHDINSYPGWTTAESLPDDDGWVLYTEHVSLNDEDLATALIIGMDAI